MGECTVSRAGVASVGRRWFSGRSDSRAGRHRSQAIVEAELNREVVIAVRAFTMSSRHGALEVRDTGPGISAENLRRLAEPYFTTRANAGSTGLGVLLSCGIVEQHKGRLEIESTIGNGTLYALSCRLQVLTSRMF